MPYLGVRNSSCATLFKFAEKKLENSKVPQGIFLNFQYIYCVGGYSLYLYASMRQYTILMRNCYSEVPYGTVYSGLLLISLGSGFNL